MGTCGGGGLALLALTWWGKFPPAAHAKLCIFGHMASSLLPRRRDLLDASQPAPASGLESAVGAADPTGDPGWPALPPRGPTHQRAATLGELQRQHQLAVTLAGGRVGTWPRPAQGVGGGRVWCLARGHPSPHPSQLNVTLAQLQLPRLRLTSVARTTRARAPLTPSTACVPAYHEKEPSSTPLVSPTWLCVHGGGTVYADEERSCPSHRCRRPPACQQ